MRARVVFCLMAALGGTAAAEMPFDFQRFAKSAYDSIVTGCESYGAIADFRDRLAERWGPGGPESADERRRLAASLLSLPTSRVTAEGGQFGTIKVSGRTELLGLDVVGVAISVPCECGHQEMAVTFDAPLSAVASAVRWSLPAPREAERGVPRPSVGVYTPDLDDTSVLYCVWSL